MLKDLGASVLSILAVFFLLVVCIQVPQPVSAGTISGTSPPIDVDQTFRVDIPDIVPGMLIEWWWRSDDNLDFWAEAPDGVEFHMADTFYMIKADQSGTYKLKWTNQNWFFTAIVTYSIVSFIPEIKLTNPSSGTISDKNPTIQGTCDLYADHIRISTNNVTFKDADRHDTNWAAEVNLSSGSNTICVESSYHLGSATQTVVRSFNINVDTFWAYKENGQDKYGMGIYLVIVLAIVLIAIALVAFVRSRRKKSQ